MSKSNLQNEFEVNVTSGVNEDKLNYKKLFFWSVLGTAAVAIVVTVLINIYEYTIFTATQKAGAASQYYDIQELRQNEQETLNSFGLIDGDRGVYHIPIDSAISLIAEE